MQVKKAQGPRLHTQENAYLLSSLMAAIQSQGKKPFAEHKPNMIPVMNKEKSASKLSFTEPGMSTYAPKSTTAVTLKSYLKKNLNQTLAGGDHDLKAKMVNKTQSHPVCNDSTVRANGSNTQRGHAGLKESFNKETEAQMQKTTRLSHGATNNGGSPAPAAWQNKQQKVEKDKKLPSKNLTINSSDLGTETMKASQLQCLTARNASIEMIDPNANAPLQPGCNISIPNHEPSKCSLKSNGVVKAYAANTNQGLVRYNINDNLM